MENFIELVPEVTTFKQLADATVAAKVEATPLLDYKQRVRAFVIGDDKVFIPKTLRAPMDELDKKAIGSCIIMQSDDEPNQYWLRKSEKATALSGF